jgi:hypothetical protein
MKHSNGVVSSSKFLFFTREYTKYTAGFTFCFVFVVVVVVIVVVVVVVVVVAAAVGMEP